MMGENHINMRCKLCKNTIDIHEVKNIENELEFIKEGLCSDCIIKEIVKQSFVSILWKVVYLTDRLSYSLEYPGIFNKHTKYNQILFKYLIKYNAWYIGV